MRKLTVSVMGIVSILAVMSCTMAGAECGLLGKWERPIVGVGTEIMEFKADDTVITTVSGGSGSISHSAKIKTADATAKTLEIEDNGVTLKYTYELACDELRLTTTGAKVTYTYKKKM